MSIAVVAGALANKPGNGGEAWVRMSWARGLTRLGFDVWFVEALGPDGDVSGPDLEAAAPVRFFDEVTRASGLADRRALIHDRGVWGTAPRELEDLADACDLLINISGHLPPGPWLDRIPCRVYVDLDPGYTQIWHREGLLGSHLEYHHAHYSVALNLGTSACSLPTGGFEWRPVLQPVVIDDWAAPAALVAGGAGDRPNGSLRFTTVASWRGAFGPVEDGGRSYGTKVHEWRRFRPMPRLAKRHRFEAALAIHDADEADRSALLDDGWSLQAPADHAGSLDAFRDYVLGSDAEFSVAQGVYVGTGSGWFSDRSARYLAAGRPVVVQDTGFGTALPVGEGLLAYDTLGEAAACVESVADDYPRHSRAARELAEARFDSDVVLGRMIEELDLCP